jgi:Ca-activated chloride channel family protein
VGDAEVSVKFVHPIWLFGSLFALVVAGLFVWGGIGLRRANRRFGDADRIRELVTARPARRRAWKGVAVVVATALAFVALARPQYGRGTKLVPATNLDVVIVLDFSKSMYARDIAPSRIARAKAEVAKLIKNLAGARFGAVAFAGEPMGFPLTSDGAAIAQFFRQLEPNDMPIGGTAIARALARARELLASDPKSHDHSRVIVLVTDGEDLEGDPVAVARAAGEEGTSVYVVQIGGRTPERIPEIGPDGRFVRYRTDEAGQPLTTALSAEGEAQLEQVATVSGGKIVRSERGTTGIDTVSQKLKQKMTEELAERVETVYADVYMYPLGAAILLLIAEVFLPESGKRGKGNKGSGTGAGPSAGARAGAKIAATLGGIFLFVSGCGWSPSRPFERQAPEVNEAVEALDAGDAGSAEAWLVSYLSTGSCTDGGFGVPDKVRQRPSASLDLGLALFQLGERYGRRFGEEERRSDAGPSPAEEQLANLRNTEVECALRAVLAIASESDVPLDLRARAHYLAGNLEFLRHAYAEAVRHYDEALKLIPGLVEGGDTIGQDAAWNRAIALERIEEEKKKDAGNDSGDQPDHNGPHDASQEKTPPPDGSPPSPDGGGNDDKKDGGRPPPTPDGGSGEDGGQSKQEPREAGPSPEQQPPPSVNQDERMLDMLESAPMFQQEDAKNRVRGRKFRGSEDK